MQKKLFLIDGMAVVYRAYFGLIRNPRINSKGENVSAVFGFINTLLDIMHTYEPTHLAVAFDTHGPTFRHVEYPEYKATRDETPEGVRTAIPHIKNLLEAFNIPILEYPGFEADDVIGTLSRTAEQQGFETYMVTPDKDYAQLVDEHTFMLKPGMGRSGELLDVPKILEQWNIEKVEQVIDILGLAGDAADNVPGVRRSGELLNVPKILEQWNIEKVKTFGTTLSPQLKYFQDMLGAPHALQAVINLPYEEFDCFALKVPAVVPAQTLLSQLL